MTMEWEIQSRSKNCCHCQKEFYEGDRYHCLLTFIDDRPLRRDFCQFCWNDKINKETDRDQIVSYWQSTVKPQLVVEKEPIKKNIAEELLRKYLHATETSHKNFCYILALMLERKKILTHKDTITESRTGKKLLVYEHTKTDETFIIENPELSLSELDSVQNQVKEILQSEQVKAK